MIDDISERKNLVNDEAFLTEKMYNMLKEWKIKVNAKISESNLDYLGARE